VLDKQVPFRPCIVIPNYNHGYALADLVRDIRKYELPTIIINDGSTDSTAKVVDELAAQHDWIVPLHRAINGGKGAAIRDGVAEANRLQCTHALCLDGDGQHAAADIPRFLQAAESSPSALILGAPRFGIDAPLARRLGREISNVIVALVTWSLSARDVLCGFRVYPVQPFVEKLNLSNTNPRMGFDVEVVIQYVWEGTRVINIPTKVHYPPTGISHFHYRRDNAALALLYMKMLVKGLYMGPRRILQKFLSGASSERGVWYQIGERGSIRGLRFLLRVLEVLGRTPLLIIMMPVVLYLFLRGGVPRQAAVDFQMRILRAKGESVSPFKVYRAAFRQFWEFGVSIVDKVVSWRGGLPITNFVWNGHADVKHYLNNGRGVLLMGAHVGNIEVIRALGDSKNVVVNALMYTGNSRSFRAFLEEVNRNAFLRVHDITDVNVGLVFTLQECIARGEIVALLADRVPKFSSERTLPIEFLGGSVQMPEGPWVLASFLDAPVFSVFSMRGDDGLYHVEMRKIVERVELPRKERTQVIAEHARHFAMHLNEVVRRYPHQWFNFYDYWGDQKKDDPTLQ
jgi:predicted LPLAT superfamily acyltransferase